MQRSVPACAVGVHAHEPKQARSGPPLRRDACRLQITGHCVSHTCVIHVGATQSMSQSSASDKTEKKRSTTRKKSTTSSRSSAGKRKRTKRTTPSQEQTTPPAVPGIDDYTQMMSMFNQPAFLNMMQQMIETPAMKNMMQSLGGAMPNAQPETPNSEGTAPEQAPNNEDLAQSFEQLTKTIMNPEMMGQIGQMVQQLNMPPQAEASTSALPPQDNGSV